jgi:carbon-monoxide dehydrogenase medium subunit
MTTFYRRLPRFEFVQPKSLAEVLTLLAEHRETAKVYAGGTDLVPLMRRREIPAPDYVIDLKCLRELEGMTYDERTGLRIGPLTTIRTMAESVVVLEHFPALAQAASSMASPQVRSRGTFAGNICNAVPSADSAPALLVFDATILLKGAKGERRVPLDRFFIGPRETVIGPDEVLLEIAVPAPAPESRSTYLKLSPRHSMDLAIVGVAARGALEDGVCKEIRIALGAAAPTPIRAVAAEEILQGKRITAELIEEAATNAITQCSPIDDHRASAEYRCDMVYAMTRRALYRVFLSEEDMV